MSIGLGIDQLAAELRELELKRHDGHLDEAGVKRRHELIAELKAVLEPRAGIERRRDFRIPAELEAQFRVGEVKMTCRASELNQGGLGIQGPLWITEDQELLVENLRVGARDFPMSVRAKVVWKTADEEKRPGAGIIFFDLDECGEHQIGAVFEYLFLAYLDRLSEKKGS